jgi:hypothetical protein
MIVRTNLYFICTNTLYDHCASLVYKFYTRSYS